MPSPLDRRSLLSLAATAASTGCLHAGPIEEATEGGRRDQETGRKLPVDPSEAVRVAAVDDDTVLARPSFGDRVEEDSYNTSGPYLFEVERGEGRPSAVLRVQITNEVDREIVVHRGSLPPAAFEGVSDSGARVRLVPTAADDFVDAAPEIRREDGVWRAGFWTPDTVQVPASETAVAEYTVVTSDDGWPDELVYFGDDTVLSFWTEGRPGPTRPSRFQEPEHQVVLAEMPDDLQSLEITWFHEATESTEVYLEPEREVVSLPDTVDFTLYNRSRDEVTGGGHHILYKLEYGEWYQVGHPRMIFHGELRLPTGSIREHLVHLRHGEHQVDEDARTSLGRLGGGVYGFTTGLSGEDGHPSALIELDAPELELQPHEDARVHRDGDEVEVEIPVDATIDYVNRSPAEETSELIVTRTDDSGDTVIAEQIYANAPNNTPNLQALRGAIPYFDEGTRKVTVEADSSSVEELFSRYETTAVYEYDGEAYEVSRSLGGTG